MKVALAGHALLGLTLLAGCGRIGYQAQATPDAHRDDADAVSRDAAADLGDARGDRIPTGDAPNDADGNAGDTGPPTMDAPATDTMSDATSPDGRAVGPDSNPDSGADASVDSGVDSNVDSGFDSVADLGTGGCAARTLCTIVEPFDQVPPSPPFTIYSDGTSTTQVSGGSFHVTATGVGGRYCGIETAIGLIAAGTIAIDSTGFPPNVTGFVVYLQLRDSAANAVEFQLSIGSLNLNVNTATTSTRKSSVTYNAVAHRFWRFRVDASTVAYEVSPDGTTWTTLSSVPPPFTGDIAVNFGAGFVVSESASASVVLPGLNAP